MRCGQLTLTDFFNTWSFASRFSCFFYINWISFYFYPFRAHLMPRTGPEWITLIIHLTIEVNDFSSKGLDIKLKLISLLILQSVYFRVGFDGKLKVK